MKNKKKKCGEGRSISRIKKDKKETIESHSLTILGKPKHVLSICPNSVTLMGLEHRDSLKKENSTIASARNEYSCLLSHTAPQRLISASAGCQAKPSLRSDEEKK